MEENISIKDVLMGIGGAIPLFVPLELLGQPQAALILGVAGGVASYVYHEEIMGFLHHRAPGLQDTQGLKKWLVSRPGENEGQEEKAQEGGETLDTAPDQDAFSVASVHAQRGSGVKRLTIAECVAHTRRNSFRLPFGLSLTQASRTAVYMNFFKRHIKIIGASTKGKSSMAGALLKIITATHDTDHVLVALLDKEHRTSRLFADLPHIAEVMVDEKPVLLHARSEDEVLLHLGYIVEIIKDRYTLTEAQRQTLPILLVYLEEFIALKDEFKKRFMMAKNEQAKEQAKKDYYHLVYCVKEIARMGLKARVQLLMCAQVDYRDDDLVEALVNVTSGISFCVKPSAAQAAGFMQTELLNKNYKSKAFGEAVVEMSDCTDLVLAPEFDLEALVLHLEKTEEAQGKTQPPQDAGRAPIVTAANGHRSHGTTAVLDRPQTQAPQENDRPAAASTINLQPTQVKPAPAQTNGIPSEQPTPTYEDAIKVWNDWMQTNGSAISRRELRTELLNAGFNCIENVARKYYDRIQEELKKSGAGDVGELGG